VEVAARHFGHATSTEVLAGSRKDGLLARLTLEERRSPAPSDEELFEAIPVRRTNRLAFDAREVPFGLVSALVREAAGQGSCCLRVVDRTMRPAVAQLVVEADRQLWTSGRYRAELAAWSRTNRGAGVDGMPGYAHGLSDSASIVHRLLMRLRTGLSAEERRDRHYALNTRALLALCSAGDTPADWFVAGQAMERVLLRAAAQGLSASYFSQAIEVAPVRVRLREALGERGFPQLLFRLGYGRTPRPTPRRPVELVLRSITDAAHSHAIQRVERSDRAEDSITWVG
jgi:hypothetical protein